MSYFSKNNLLQWIIILLLVIILSAVGTLIHTMRVGHKGFRQYADSNFSRLDKMKEILNLTDAQFNQIKKLKSKHLDAQLRIRKEMFDKRREFVNELTSDNPDTNKLNTMIPGLVNLQLEMRKESVKQFLEIKAVCNPDQQKKLQLFVKDKMSAGVYEKIMKNRFSKRRFD